MSITAIQILPAMKMTVDEWLYLTTRFKFQDWKFIVDKNYDKTIIYILGDRLPELANKLRTIEACGDVIIDVERKVVNFQPEFKRYKAKVLYVTHFVSTEKAIAVPIDQVRKPDRTQIAIEIIEEMAT